MGYRDSWLNHTGGMTAHSEVMLHVLDRVVGSGSLRLLLIGVENGGALQVWQQSLPEGSEVVGIDADPRCAIRNTGVLIGDMHDRQWLRKSLGSQWFDLVIDSTGEMPSTVWPYLRAGGFYVLERYEPEALLGLVASVVDDQDSWLPTEEIMQVMVFPVVAAIEKRNPRVVPYLDVLVGYDDSVVPESVYRECGALRIQVPDNFNPEGDGKNRAQ